MQSIIIFFCQYGIHVLFKIHQVLYCILNNYFSYIKVTKVGILENNTNTGIKIQFMYE